MQPIDWTAIEARQGPISQERRALIEMQVLADESQRLLTRADQVERWGAAERETVAAAYTAGKTVEQYEADLQDQLGDPDEREYEAAVDYSGPGGDFDLQPAAAFENQYPETKNFEDLTDADVAYLAEKYPEEWARDTDDTVSETPYEGGRSDVLHGRLDAIAIEDPEFSDEYRRGRRAGAEELARVEDQIRQTYRQVAGDRDRLVPLTELRAALPADLSREQVDAALTNLRDHSDVHLSPRTAQRNASPETQAAALAVGGAHDHQLSIDRTQNPERVAERLHSRDEVRATSMVAALSDSNVLEVAREMGVPVGEDVQQVRADLVATSVANRDAWLTDARQGANDGTLLYRADTEPQWAASLTGDERQELAAAAARLQQRAATEPAWAYVKDRADRWADPGTSVDNPTPARESDGATRQRETGTPAREADPEAALAAKGEPGVTTAQEVTELAEQLRTEREDVYGDPAADVQDELDWRARTTGDPQEHDPAKYHEVDDELARLAAGGMTAGDMERDDAEHLSPEERRWFEAQEEAANRESLETPDRADAGEHAETGETADPGPVASIGPELRAARTYLEQRTEREPAPPATAERDTAAVQEQAHRASARVMTERQQAEPQRGIER